MQCLPRKPTMAVVSRCPARPGLKAPRSASMALQALAPGELRGALGRLGYLWLCAEGGKANFVAAPDLFMLPVPP